MKNVNENQSLTKFGLFQKGPTFIKVTGFVGVSNTVKHADDGLAQVEMPPVTASEQMFLESHAS
jgi:hypothetical protein